MIGVKMEEFTVMTKRAPYPSQRDSSAGSMQRARRIEILSRIYSAFSFSEREAASLEARLAVYEQQLAHVPVDVLEAAASRGLSRWRYRPTIPEIIDVVREIEEEAVNRRALAAPRRSRPLSAHEQAAFALNAEADAMARSGAPAQEIARRRALAAYSIACEDWLRGRRATRPTVQEYLSQSG